MFETVTETCVDPVFPAASTAWPTIVCEPLATFFVSQGIDTGPRLPVVLPTSSPLTVSVYVFAVLVVPSSHTTTHDVPLTVVPAFGEVITSFSVSVLGGGKVTSWRPTRSGRRTW